MFFSSIFGAPLIFKIKNKFGSNKNSTGGLNRVVSSLSCPSFSGEEKVEIITKIKKVLEEDREGILKFLGVEIKKPMTEGDKELTSTLDLLEKSRELAFIKSDGKHYPVLGILSFDTPLLSMIKVFLLGFLLERPVVLKPSSWTFSFSEYILKLVSSILGDRYIAILDIPGKDLEEEVSSEDFPFVYIEGLYSTVKSFSTSYRGNLFCEYNRGGVAVVAEGADVDQVVSEVISAAFSYNGQYCCAFKGVVVPEKFFEAFSKKIVDRTEKFYCPGDPLDPATTATPLVDNTDVWYAYAQISDAIAEGAELLFGGEHPEENKPLIPSVIAKLRPNSKLVNEDYRIPYMWIVPYQHHPDDFISQIFKEKRIIIYGEEKTLAGRLRAVKSWEVLERNSIPGILCFEGGNPYEWLKRGIAVA